MPPATCHLPPATRSLLVALDPGFGNTKVCIDGRTATIQTAVARPHAIGLAATGLRAGPVRTVSVSSPIRSSDGGGREGVVFAVGPHAWLHGEPITSLDFSALAGPERNALFYSSLGELLPAGKYTVEQLIVGLPVSLLQDRDQAQACFDSLRALKSLHEFTLDDKPGIYRLDIQKVKILAQPVGAYADWLIDADLHIRKNGKDAEIAVLDIGLNTLDLYVLRGGEVEPRFISGAKVGVRRLLAHLIEDQEMEEMDAELRAGRLRANPAQLTAWMNELLAVIEKAWSSLRRFTAVIPTGGGALVLGDLLRGELARRGAAVAWPEDPITANVRGLWKWYAQREKQESKTKKLAAVAASIPPVASRRRGRPPKNTPIVKCSQCERGIAGLDGLCTTCHYKAQSKQNARHENAIIDAIVKHARVDGMLDRIQDGEIVGARKVG